MIKIVKLNLNVTKIIKAPQCSIATSALRTIDQKWREERGLTENPNAFGPLTNLPDYTFLDGRTTPMGSNQKKRLLKQQEIAQRIVQLSSELDYAKERYKNQQQAALDKKRSIMQNKLKPKGHLLLKELQKENN